MSFNFPSIADVHLENAPLAEVVCQVRFPPILRIANEQPAEFQERIRAHFPQTAAEQSLLVKVSLTSPPTALDAQPTIYRFSTPDGDMVASLGVDFYALSTEHYTHWKDFAELLDLVQRSAREVYRLPFSTRIGLRYVNRLTPKAVGLSGKADALNMVRPEMTALLSVGPLSDSNEMLAQVVLADGGERLTIRVGFGIGKDDSFVLLDFDRFAEGQLPLDDLNDRCQQYHDTIYNAFRWSIPETQWRRFGPQPVE